MNIPVESHVKYDKITDALYILLRNRRIIDSDEVAPGIIVDLNENNEIIGIEILQILRRKLDLLKLLMKGLKALVVVV